MQRIKLLLFLLFIGGSWRHVRCTCVLESEFGFALNCAFKKSGLFRVRNLGGIKAHVGLGFTVGDELGFSESLSNVEGNRRRSTQTNGLQNKIIQNQELLNKRITANQMNDTSSAARTKTLYRSQGTIPPFRPIPPAAERPVTPQRNNMMLNVANQPKPMRVISNMQGAASPSVVGVAVPVFESMPTSITRKSGGVIDGMKQLENSTITKNTLPTSQSTKTIQTLLAIPNISIEDLKAALIREKTLNMKQKVVTSSPPQPQMLPVVKIPEVTTPRVAANQVLTLKRVVNNSTKVMNAPKQYYPVGYDKNFDDNFASKVELPDTTFYCGNQKHFPGLYADEDLGCMVFHVCALTDDGLLMKSFLCPESTLFDQTILKCNWWFYVDCKNSKKLYDSNIPISKSYQLMKALTFFTQYQKEQNSTK